jgi:hypothetical protein
VALHWLLGLIYLSQGESGPALEEFGRELASEEAAISMRASARPTRGTRLAPCTGARAALATHVPPAGTRSTESRPTLARTCYSPESTRPMTAAPQPSERRSTRASVRKRSSPKHVRSSSGARQTPRPRFSIVRWRRRPWTAQAGSPCRPVL